MASLVRGKTLTKGNYKQAVTISWKQGSFLGMGGDQSQRYSVYEYRDSDNAVIPVYIQSGWNAPDRLKVDSSLQYGMNDGIFFLVYHDKSQTPYQHRFIQNLSQKAMYAANSLVKAQTGGYLDLSWAVGDYLHTF